jgi:ribosomal protein L11 methyltransferase
MTWWEIAVSCGEAIDPETVAALLVQETGQTAEEREGSVVGYAGAADLAARAARAISDRFGPKVAVTVDQVEPVDWSSRWREGFSIRKIGRLEIGPSWLLPVGPRAVVIDPETAFGTGEHGSTRGAIALLDRHLRAGARVLDLGSGSGILGVAAAKLGADRVLGIELDPEAIPVARENAARNQVADRVEFLEGEAGVLAPLGGPVDLLLSNILRTANLALLDSIGRALRPGGIAIFAGMESAEAHLFELPLGAAGFEPIDQTTDEGWWSVAARTR